MGLSSAVDWWEEWQLRILVIGSQCVQWILFFSASRRKSIVSASLRLLIWFAYLGSDAVAIYALAALFNRHRKELRNSHGESILEVVWAPVLLMHLGGQDCITAYNMEDNELWKRHALISLAQVTVSIYVFCKSWRGGDKKLLQAAIMLFTLGVIRCLEKPFALQKASINSLVSSSDTTAKLPNKGKNCQINLLEEYVKKAMSLYRADHLTRAQGEGDPRANHHYDNQARGEDDIEANHSPDQSHGEDGGVKANSLSDQVQKKGDSMADASEADSDHLKLGTDQVNKLFVDLASPYYDRLSVTKAFLKLDEEEAYEQLQERLSDTFDLLYTKAKMVLSDEDSFFWGLAGWFRFACVILPFAAIGLFHRSHREAYNDKDVKVTYTLLCCTAVMELFSYQQDLGSKLSGMVPQYSFMGYFARNKKYTTRMSILSCLRCKEYVNQQWSMKPSNSSFRITILVRQQVIGWWTQHIGDAAAYTRFNNHRGQWTIRQAGCGQLLGWSIKRSFDESVLLWHIATDICFYKMGVKSRHGETTEGCRDISNYMMYLLYTKPEMLMAGSRRNLLIAAYRQLDIMLESHRQPPVDERAVAHKLIAVVKESPEGGLIHDSWDLAKLLLDLNDDNKMWKVIEGMWVDMLCYSASRCQGYLHAKSLGTGGELLTFVWLLWSHMGMETLAERMQMSEADLPSEEENKAPKEEDNRAPREVENCRTVEMGPSINAFRGQKHRRSRSMD